MLFFNFVPWILINQKHPLYEWQWIKLVNYQYFRDQLQYVLDS
jgi:hypothetical protein